MFKVCTLCKETKPLEVECFYRSPGGRWRSRCHKCHALVRKRAVQSSREKYRAQDERYRNRPEVREERRRADRDRHESVIVSRMVEDPKFAEERKRNRRENAKRYRLADPQRYRAADARKRQKETPAQKLKKRMGCTIQIALKGRKAGRSWEGLVGYSADDLHSHLERQFLPGMTWDNMGSWHIDHIVPQASFRFDDPLDSEFRAAWALTNLRPLWARDNLSKGARRTVLL